MTRSIDEIKANITAKAQASEPTTKKKQTLPPTIWTAEVVNLADVEAEDISWLWCPYIPLGKVSIVQGDGGLGKSWLTLAIASAVTRGHPLPGQDGTPGTTTSPQTVVILSAEDDLADTIRPRLDALQAAPERIYAIRAKSTTREDGERIEASITLADVPLLRQVVEKVRPALVVIDPLAAYLGAATDMHRSNEVRPLLAALGDLAAAFDLAVVIVHHLNKNTAAKAAYRGAGSYDIGAAVRSILVVAEDPEDPQKRIIAHAKSNLAATGASLAFTLRDGAFSWAGTSTLTAEQLLSQPVSSDERTARDEATDWLLDVLGDGPLPVKTLKQNAPASWPTVERAKAALGIKARRSGTKPTDPWEWALPEAHHHPPISENVMACDGLSTTPMNTAPSTHHHRPSPDSYREPDGVSQDRQALPLAVLPGTRPGRQEPQDSQDRQAPTPRDAPPLTDRAETWRRTLEGASRDDLDALRTDNLTEHTPEMWEATFKVEPLPVTVASVLIREDVSSGTYRPGSHWQYLNAARAATKGTTHA